MELAGMNQTPEIVSHAPALPVIVSVVIVNWNSKQHVLNCLRSLFHHTAGIGFEVIVVDGGSYDGVEVPLAEHFPSVKFIQSPTNVGFGRCNNLGVRHARGTYLLLLNPDTVFLENSLSVMLDRLTTLPRAGAIGCRLLNSDHSIQTSSILSFPTILNRTLGSAYTLHLFRKSTFWGTAPLFSGKSTPTEVEAVSGACILMRKDHFDRIGGFTESYFMYTEDVDLCYKLRAANLKVFHIPETAIIHLGGGSSQLAPSNFSAVMMRDSWYQFIRLHRGRLQASIFKMMIFLTASVRLLLIAPLLVFGTRFVKHGRSSIRKWLAILWWSLRSREAGRPV
jgi:GT2 family glycosyltransferase